MRRLAVWCWVLVGVSSFKTVPEAFSKPYTDFTLLKPQACSKLDQSAISKLPEVWHRYADYVKKFPLTGHTKAGVSIVSIWILDYLKVKYPRASHIWEDFPLPILVDAQLNMIGMLPEHYPDDPPRELDIFYSTNSKARPEIKVRVYNPAVNGDYSYGPMTWNKNKDRYLLKNSEVNYGK